MNFTKCYGWKSSPSMVACGFAILAMLLASAVNSRVFAQEPAAATPSDAVEQTPGDDPATNPSAESSEESETKPSEDGDCVKPDAAKAETEGKNEAESSDTSKVVPATGDAENALSNGVENVSFELASTHSAAMTVIHNRYRNQAGLTIQSIDPDLTNVAQRWADHMASVGSMYHGGGEQIIAYSGGDLSYDAGFRLWLNSSPHRAWLYSRGDRCGFGYSIGRNGCAYFAGAFGSSYRASSDDSSGGTYQSVSSSNGGRRFRIFRRRG